MCSSDLSAGLMRTVTCTATTIIFTRFQRILVLLARGIKKRGRGVGKMSGKNKDKDILDKVCFVLSSDRSDVVENSLTLIAQNSFISDLENKVQSLLAEVEFLKKGLEAYRDETGCGYPPTHEDSDVVHGHCRACEWEQASWERNKAARRREADWFRRQAESYIGPVGVLD